MILSTLLFYAVTTSPIAESPAPPSRVETAIHSVCDPALYLGAGVILGSATFLSGMGWALSQLTPWSASLGNECQILSRVLGTASLHALGQAAKTFPLSSFFFKRVTSSCASWEENKNLLSQIPASSPEDYRLLDFLEKRWLAKTTGCYPFLVNWMCPCFGISYQLHPESTNSYARLPSNKLSDTYKNRVEAWKKFLPHPDHFPLLLTRPTGVREHLPACVEIAEGESIDGLIDKIKKNPSKTPVIVDLTSSLPESLHKRDWIDFWNDHAAKLTKGFKDANIDTDLIVCIHRVQQQDVGGIRLLPLSEKNREKGFQFLMDWVSNFGLSANRVELDRSGLDSSAPRSNSSLSLPVITRESWLSFFKAFETDHLMVKGAVNVIHHLLSLIPEEKWNEIASSPTRGAIVQLSLTKIRRQLQETTKENLTFHEIASQMEQVHADLTSLLEIFSPYGFQDFPAIYQEHLTSIPTDLRPLTRYGIHTSGMTTLGSIFRATSKSLGRPLKILYGENTYFEAINVSEEIAKAGLVPQASDQEWKEVDLLLLQFNPTVKRINFKVTEYQATDYRVERVGEAVRRALSGREGRPLCVALDCTLDYSDSFRTGNFLYEFQEELARGDLIVIGYRSGLKFDLFGMDNYCGAPFFMVHSGEEKWSAYNGLLTDPALATDRLSLNWFCLAYTSTAPYLELYRKQIFDNTRAVLDKIPQRLFNRNNPFYRVIPIDRDADASFIDIKIFGPFHALRGDLLAGVSLTVKCMEAGHPLLFRPGIGFYHPNLAVLFGKDCTTVRLTVGLDPAQVDIIAGCLSQLDACNNF